MNNLSFEDLDTYLLNKKGKIIHQIWFGNIPNKKEAKKTYEKLIKYQKTWIINNPSWYYMLWNIPLTNNLVKEFYKHHESMYKNYPYQIQRCDTVRYFILHRYGGLYADMDYICYKSWDTVVNDYKKDLYLVETPNKFFNDLQVSNSLMFSKPRHVFWDSLFIELEKNQSAPIYYSRHLTIMFTTGPGIINRVFDHYKTRYNLNYYPYKLFHPRGVSHEVDIINNKNIYAMHIGKGSWETSDSKLIIFIYQEYKILLFITVIFIILFFIISRQKR